MSELVLETGKIETLENNTFRVFVNAKNDYLPKTYDSLNKAKSALRGASSPPKRKVATPVTATTPVAATPVATPTSTDWKSGDMVVKAAQTAARQAKQCEGTKLFCGTLWTLGGFLRGSKRSTLHPDALSGFDKLYKVARDHAEHRMSQEEALKVAVELGVQIASNL
jgi:hypothetical protein